MARIRGCVRGRRIRIILFAISMSLFWRISLGRTFHLGNPVLRSFEYLSANFHVFFTTWFYEEKFQRGFLENFLVCFVTSKYKPLRWQNLRLMFQQGFWLRGGKKYSTIIGVFATWNLLRKSRRHATCGRICGTVVSIRRVVRSRKYNTYSSFSLN